MLKLNSKALNFSAQDQFGKTQTLSEQKGKWIVLYFYPKDDTPGCTKEACNFRDSNQAIINMGVVIWGVSKDTVTSHKKFADKYHLNFPLLADPEKQIIEKYQAWGTKKFMGKEFSGTLRITYLIDPKGMIKKVYEKVNPLFHAGEIINEMKRLEIVT